MKRCALLLIFTLLILPFISAVQVDMKSEFNQGETLIAKVSGNFVDSILKENIAFYRGHVKIPIIFDVAKIEDEFYVYAFLSGKTAGNYSISIEDVRYIKSTQTIDEEIIRNFTITNETADFSINPGFVIANQDFSIKVQNLQDFKKDIKIKIKTNSGNNTSEGGFLASLFGGGLSDGEETILTLDSDEIKKIDFNVDNIKESAKRIVEFSTDSLTYQVPVYIFLNKTTKEKKEIDFEFNPSELNISMPTTSNMTRIIYLYNKGKSSLENITLSVSDSLDKYVSLPEENIEELDENSSVRIELVISSDDREKFLNGQITAKVSNDSKDFYAYSFVSLNFIKDYIPLEGEDDSVIISKNCSEIGGTICEDKKEKCDKEEEYTKDGICCTGTCEKIEKSSAGKIIGWLLVIVIILFLFWFIKQKYKGARKNIDLLKIAEGKK